MMRQQPPALRALLLQLGRASDHHQGQGLARQLSYSTSKEEYLQIKDARNELAAQGARELGLEGIDLQALRGARRVFSSALCFFTPCLWSQNA